MLALRRPKPDAWKEMGGKVLELTELVMELQAEVVGLKAWQMELTNSENSPLRQSERGRRL